MSNKKTAKQSNNKKVVLNMVPIIVNHKGDDVELTKDNIGLIYNTNYINSFLDKVNESIDNDETLDIEIISKYDIFVQYKLQSLQRKKERLLKKDSNDKVSELMSKLSPEEVEKLLASKK